MRILLYAINFAPELTGAGKYTGEMAQWLTARGHEVRVVTAPPYYPQWQVQPPYRANRWQRERWQGIEIWRCPLWVPPKPGGLKRLLHLASFALSSLPVMLGQARWRPDWILMVEPTLFCAPTTLLTAQLAGAHSWLHIQDFEVDAAFELGLMAAPSARRLALGLERGLLRRFSQVSTISEKMYERLLAKGVARAQASLFPNWVDLQAVQPLAHPSVFRAELGLADDAVVALYAGNMGQKQGLEILIDAARLLQDQPRLVFVLAGAGSARSRLETLAADLPNVRWLPLQPVERLNELLNLADIHLLPQRADAADLVMPSKLTGMLASGRPVVASAAPDTQVARVVNGCGLVVLPGDAHAFAAALRELAADPARRHELGLAARAQAEHDLGCEAILSRFERTALAALTTPSFDSEVKP
mgnify:CR=1 FL=1